ncbi:hypothetical protein GNI_149490 [Gregarina niphandrodes]|uniref:Uncharacterized protein n=1 Tax=Gregarina niphandrodes TaxID=110365 RepID=A0A023AZJ7_GRENI|nr:hypothetical protein GNI_149490 [Gregarina niphandrodes]EZG44278.1 hypothetical protein GNI_149490 [Gregarina niphandrodes]|eukprot:XP_011132729.1 hypothetical protein GNI_149490 [Gregarina niphandrodes]
MAVKGGRPVSIEYDDLLVSAESPRTIETTTGFEPTTSGFASGFAPTEFVPVARSQSSSKRDLLDDPTPTTWDARPSNARPSNAHPSDARPWGGQYARASPQTPSRPLLANELIDTELPTPVLPQRHAREHMVAYSKHRSFTSQPISMAKHLVNKQARNVKHWLSKQAKHFA